MSGTKVFANPAGANSYLFLSNLNAEYSQQLSIVRGRDPYGYDIILF
jgi:DNA topoisomerase VI subunit A